MSPVRTSAHVATTISSMNNAVRPENERSGPQHKRTTSSVLKSMMSPKRNAPADMGLSGLKGENVSPLKLPALVQPPILPPDHPQARYHLREQNGNTDNIRSPSKKPVDIHEDNVKSTGLHKKTKSSVSLKSLIGNEKSKASKSKSLEEEEEAKSMKKSKSSTSLSILLSRPKSSKSLKLEDLPRKKDKENRTPPNSANAAPPPIWAQFASQQILEPTTSKIPLNDRRNFADEIALYTPRDYSPSKQRNFQGYEQPTLSRKTEPKPRPKSAFITSGPSTSSFAGNLAGLHRPSMDKSRQAPNNDGADQRSSSEMKSSSRRSSLERYGVGEVAKSEARTNKRGSRVMAAVAAFNGKSNVSTREANQEPQEVVLDVKAIETAFEILLDSRNVPQHTRDKMRSLDTNIKANFIKQDKNGPGSASSKEGSMLRSADAQVNSRPSSGKRSKTESEILTDSGDSPEVMDQVESPKKSRPRSRTFTFSKSDSSPSKKQKAERPKSHVLAKSVEVVPCQASSSLTTSGAAQAAGFLNPAPKAAVPEEFISYLRKVQKPELVEVGRLHKLRQLLRNETVAWVDVFIEKGGMAEVVGLLYRIIAVEWREEHEDVLLHETLLCLKALCTTSLALHQLSAIQPTLFPILLAMLFDEEKKGPSEFITRNIIISLLFTNLSTSPSHDLVSRARTILSYLRDPSKPEEAQPPGFIASMHHPRPYRVWCKEIVNVTKEVFWIFLHHLNIIPCPPQKISDDPCGSYCTMHFPSDRPPVPAAPYVGGVEWEATNYLAAHLDLLNGLIAALPSREERNALREELKDSGFEKCMGGSLRTCKEKFYGSVHAGLTTWVGAAKEDGWDIRFVREGPKREEVKMSPKKGKVEKAPRIEMPKLDLGVGGRGGGGDDGAWL